MGEENLYGIDQSKPFATLVSGMVTAAVNIDTDQDGKIETKEILNAFKNAAVEVMFKHPDLKAIKKEGLDYTEEEKDILANEFADKNKIRNAKARVLTNRAFKMALDILDFAIDAQRPQEWFEGV